MADSSAVCRPEDAAWRAKGTCCWNSGFWGAASSWTEAGLAPVAGIVAGSESGCEGAQISWLSSSERGMLRARRGYCRRSGLRSPAGTRRSLVSWQAIAEGVLAGCPASRSELPRSFLRCRLGTGRVIARTVAEYVDEVRQL